MGSLRAARAVGIVVFLAGIGLLSLVFYRAMSGLSRPMTGPPAQSGLFLAREFAMLLVMGIVASSVAGRGAQLFQAGQPIPGAILDPGPDPGSRPS